jgi:Gram-negative porin
MSSKRRSLAATTTALALYALVAPADAAMDDYVTFSGFGTLGAIHSDYADADFIASVSQPRGVGYSRSWSVTPDSDLGGQANFALTDELSGVVQVLSRDTADGNFKPTVEWANLKYDFNPDLSVRLGRILLPTYEHADTRNVGYSLPWVRVPVEITYASTATHSDGVDAAYRLHTGAITQEFLMQWGSTQLDLPGAEFTLNSAHVALLSDSLQYGNANLHLVYLQTDPSQNPPGRLRMEGVGFAYEPGPWFASMDSNRTHNGYFGTLEAWYVSAGIRIGNFTPYAFYSATHQESLGSSTLTSLGNQHTVAAGTRWDFAKNVDLKLQVEQVTIESLDDPASFANLQPGARAGDKAHVVSLALDFLF